MACSIKIKRSWGCGGRGRGTDPSLGFCWGPQLCWEMEFEVWRIIKPEWIAWQSEVYNENTWLSFPAQVLCSAPHPGTERSHQISLSSHQKALYCSCKPEFFFFLEGEEVGGANSEPFLWMLLPWNALGQRWHVGESFWGDRRCLQNGLLAAVRW